MSTRAQITIYNNGELAANYYHHHDGYPQYLGNLLVNMAKVVDVMYAQQGMLSNFERLFACEDDFEKEPLESTHGDAEYIYQVHIDEKANTTSVVFHDVHAEYSADLEAEALEKADNWDAASELRYRALKSMLFTMGAPNTLK